MLGTGQGCRWLRFKPLNQSRDLYLSVSNIPSEASAINQSWEFHSHLLFEKKKNKNLKVSWFYFDVEKVLLSKSQEGLWDEKEAGPFPPCF